MPILGVSGIASGNITAPPVVNSAVCYRKKYGVVYIQGNIGIKNKVSNASLPLFTIPYKPLVPLNTFSPLTGNSIARYYISTNGTISLEWARKLGDASEITGDISWVGFDICYPTQ